MANTRSRSSRWSAWQWIGLCLFLFAASIHAQPAVAPYVTASGGGMASNALYVVTDTIGQPVASAASSLTYAVDEGFWGTSGSPVSLLTWANPAPIIYGAPLTSNQLNATTSVPGSFVYTPTNGAVLNAGTNTLSVLFSPTDTVLYSNVIVTVSLVVAPAVLTATAANTNRAYGQTNPAFTGAIVGLTNGDNISAAYSCNATNNSPLGTYSIVPSLVDPNNRQTNYTVNLVNGTLTVTQAIPQVTWTNPAPIIYGTLLGTNQLNAAATVPGSFAYTPTNGTIFNAGTNSLSVVFTPTDMVDYTSATNAASIVVEPAVLTPSVTVQTSKPYDGTPSASIVSVSLSGYVLGDSSLTVNLGGSGVASYADSNIGTAKTVTITGLSLSGPSASNYVLSSTTVATTANITADTVTIVSGLTVSNRVYDGTNAGILSVTNTIVLAGLTNGDLGHVTLSTNGYRATFATSNVNSNVTVTVTGLTLTGGSSANYILVQPAFTASITPAPVTIISGLTVNPVTYGALTGLDAAFLSITNIVLEGVLAQDTNSVFLETNGYQAYFTETNANPDVPVTVSGLTLGGGEATNYYLIEPSPLGTIFPATLTYSATATSQAYGSANTNFTGGVSGFVYSDTLSSATAGTAVFTSTTTAISPLGSYAINGSGLTASNYIFSQSPGNANALTILLEGGTYPYNITITNTFTYSYPALETFSGVISGPGTLNITGSGTLVLTAPDTYTGRTTISNGTLVLSGSGSISNTAGVTLGSGGTLDVSGLGASNTFNMPGTNFVASGDALALIVGPLDGFVNLGSLPIILTNDGVGPSLLIEQGTLVLDGNVVVVDTFGGSPLPAGSYTVIQQVSGNINGPVASAVTGTAIGAGTLGLMSIEGGNMVLTIVNTTSTTTTLTGNTPVIYGNPLNIAATTYPTVPDGESVVFYNGATPIWIGTTLGGKASLTVSSLPVGTYSITAQYLGNLTNLTSTSAAVSQTVNPATLAVVAENTNIIVGAAIPGFTYRLEGFVNGDSATVVTGVPILTSMAASTSFVGLYPITVSAGSLIAANYTFKPVDGLLAITAMGSVYINIVNNGNGTVTLSFMGSHGATYILQAATDLSSAASWSNISTNIAGANGSFAVTNAITGAAQYFRAVQP